MSDDDIERFSVPAGVVDVAARARPRDCGQIQVGASLLTFLVVFGPGLIVMVADNDAGAVSTYTQAGAQYGTHLLWLLLLLLPVTYFVQEMVVRLGIATGKGHAAMIYQRFGKWWGRFSLVDLRTGQLPDAGDRVRRASTWRSPRSA